MKDALIRIVVDLLHLTDLEEVTSQAEWIEIYEEAVAQYERERAADPNGVWLPGMDR